MLPAFLKWLHEKYVIDCHCIKDKDGTGFHTRFRIQKCVYMAQRLGLGTGYNYENYVYGPYSRELTRAYYDYDPTAPIDEPLPPDFEQIGDVVLRAHSKGYTWLEVATTILEGARKRSDAGGRCTRDLIEGDAADQTFQYPDRYIRAVYDDLLKTPLGEGLPTAESALSAIQTP